MKLKTLKMTEVCMHYDKISCQTGRKNIQSYCIFKTCSVKNKQTAHIGIFLINSYIHNTYLSVFENICLKLKFVFFHIWFPYTTCVKMK